LSLWKGRDRLAFICVRIRIRKCLVQKHGITILITVAAIIIKCNLMLSNSLYAHWGGTDTLLSNYDENVPKFFYIYNKIRRAQRTYPSFFLIFFSVALELRQSEKPEELLELMTRAIQNTGLLWPLRARSQPSCRFYFARGDTTLWNSARASEAAIWRCSKTSARYEFKASINGRIN